MISQHFLGLEYLSFVGVTAAFRTAKITVIYGGMNNKSL
jgi:hypothetical protein